jgi:AraC-like DNA-binding protein
MNKIHLNTHNIKRIFETFQIHLGGKLNKRPDEYQLVLDNEIAKGEIRGFYLDTNLVFFEYDLVFSQITEIISNSPATNPIFFLYCAQGKLEHSFGQDEEKVILNQFQTGIFSCNAHIASVLSFGKDISFRGTVITLATSINPELEDQLDFLSERAMQKFAPQSNQQTFSYTGFYNLKIADQLQQLEKIKQKGLIRNLLFRGIVRTALAMKIEQYEEDLKIGIFRSSTLSEDDIDEIKELSIFIRNYPERAYSIEQLTKLSGLSAAKLQEGFKLYYHQTVSAYIRSVRVQHAEDLIKNTNMNISEIVYSIGLTSRSYFSKIFREKFDCSPKFYQDNQLRNTNNK